MSDVINNCVGDEWYLVMYKKFIILLYIKIYLQNPLRLNLRYVEVSYLSINHRFTKIFIVLLFSKFK
jgi:hypothetical protein